MAVETGRRRVGPVDDCVPAVAAFFDCRAWGEKSAAGTLRHVFFGLPADVAAARYLYELVERAFDTETGEMLTPSSTAPVFDPGPDEDEEPPKRRWWRRG